MVDRTKATSTTAGILRPGGLARHARIERVPAGEVVRELSTYVEYHWTLRWDLPAGVEHAGGTLPHPACTLSVEIGEARDDVGEDRVVVTGVVRRRFDVRLRGSGVVHGTKFRPGGLAALTGGRARDLTDRTCPAVDVVGEDSVATLRELERGAPATAVNAARRAEDALAPLVPPEPDPAYVSVVEVVADLLADRSVVLVAQMEERHGWSRRHLERLFARYVGATPKWVIARYRMHDVLSALDGGYDGSLTDLAASYGWYDQAHFARDFVALVGVTPSTYRVHHTSTSDS